MENKWNDKEILRKLRQRILDRLEVVGKYLDDSAKLLCPVDTANLRDSINHKVIDSELSVISGTNVEYGPYVELGTGEHAENGQGRKGGWFYTDSKGKGHFTLGNKPQPFLRPALLNNKGTIGRILIS